MIQSDAANKRVNVDNARCVIHFDLPSSKGSFAHRLWHMRRHFGVQGEAAAAASSNNASASAVVDLCSFLFFTPDDRAVSAGLLAHLKRVGHDEHTLPAAFVSLAKRSDERDEEARASLPLCPFVKSYGQCVDNGANVAHRCPYRHAASAQHDAMHRLDDELCVPNEGYVRFKVTHAENTNVFYVNLIGHDSLRRDSLRSYTRFAEFDLDMQMHFADERNVVYLDSFKQKDLFAFKDRHTSIYKRIAVCELIRCDEQIVFEIVVRLIDYGATMRISTHELVQLPERFKRLPPQAVECYVCDIRPTDADLYWSTNSSLFVGEKLAKTKEFVGKIQMAAGSYTFLIFDRVGNPIAQSRFIQKSFEYCEFKVVFKVLIE